MTADEWTARVDAGLEFLPPGGEPQALLRRVYRAARLRALARHGDAGRAAADVPAAAQASVRRLYPAAAFIVAGGFPD